MSDTPDPQQETSVSSSSEPGPFDPLKSKIETTLASIKEAIPELEDPSSLKAPLNDAQREKLRSAIQQLFDYERQALQKGTSASDMIAKVNFLTWMRSSREPLRTLLFKNGELLIKQSDQVISSVQNQSREAAATLNQLALQAEQAVKEASAAKIDSDPKAATSTPSTS